MFEDKDAVLLERVVCTDEVSARAEAERRQSREQTGARWTYFKSEGEWVAQRLETRPAPKKTWKERARDYAFALLDPTGWLN